MKRLTESWFEFGGVKSSSMGVILRAMPRRPIPAERVQAITVPGRSGSLWIGENGAYDAIKISAECESAAGYDSEKAAAWLKGRTGMLRFSDEPERAYRARCIASFARENKFLSFDTQIFTVEFDCQPHRYVYPAPENVTLTGAGTIVNAGTAESLPRIAITAAGDYTVTVNGYEIEVTGGSAVIDSELEDCFDADGVTLANNRVRMSAFPRLKGGANSVSWTGNVSSVTIERRSRSL